MSRAQRTKGYAWQDGDKWKLSALPKSVQNRPANIYDNQAALIEEAGIRDMEVVWENG